MIVHPDSENVFAQAVDDALKAFVVDQRQLLQGAGTDIADLLDIARDFVLGGKLVRPRFCRAGWLVAGGDPDDSRLPVAAAAWEWLQGSALVHDDLMDDSATRRGRPSVHRAARERHRSDKAVGDPDAFGLSQAVLIGDLMLSWVDAQFRRSGLDLVPAGLAVIDACKSEVVAGQYLDVLTQTRAHSDEETVRSVLVFKTAKYTIERPLHCGAVLAGADDTLLRQLSDIAIPLGTAFQLRDDVLGVFGDPATTGKPAGDDLREGKRTLLIARVEQLGTPLQRAAIGEWLGRSEGIDILREIIVDSGALASVEREIASLSQTTHAAIDALGGSARDILGPLADRMVDRQA